MSAVPPSSGPLDPQVALALLRQGQELAEGGDYAPAAAAFARVVGNGDANLHLAALLGLAECRYRMDDDTGALQAWIAATQAPEGPLTWRAGTALAGARVREGDLPAATRAYREAERRAPAAERAAIASRLGWLSKEQGDTRAAGRYFGRWRGPGARPPVVTWTLLAVTAVIGLASELSPQVQLWFYELFALWKPGVEAGEWWRLVTVVLVHGGFLHLAFNLYALFIIGPTVEALYGSARFALLYVLCAIGGSVASYVFNPGILSVGASGASFGLFGVLLVADRVHKPALTRGARNLTTQIGGLIAVNIAIGLIAPSIDNAAHVGGLIAGCWLGLMLVPDGVPTLRSFWQGMEGRPWARPLLAIAGVGGVLLVSLAGLLLGRAAFAL
ncbi:MAG: rhomboid family intramembrane serine protease [Chloroflexota bacterium]